MSDNDNVMWWEKPLKNLSNTEWEKLCDGCGLCCLNKLEDIDTGRVYVTNVACNLLDLDTCQCSNYAKRQAYVIDCIQLTYADLAHINWLPSTCSYVLRYNNKSLPEWHHLISGDREAVHKTKVSHRGRLIHEQDVKGLLRDHVIEEVK